MKFWISINEPLIFERLLVHANNFVTNNYILSKMIPYTADMFVFTYPVYLVWLYLYWINKKSESFKELSLFIFFSSISTILTNLIIQFFIDKERPHQLVWMQDDLIFENVPIESFPSDHAALSATIAMSTMIWGIKNRDKNIINISIILWIFSITMSISRFVAGIHWLTDVVFGTIIGIIIPIILFKWKIYEILKKHIFYPLIKLEKYLFKKIFWINQ